MSQKSRNMSEDLLYSSQPLPEVTTEDEALLESSQSSEGSSDQKRPARLDTTTTSSDLALLNDNSKETTAKSNKHSQSPEDSTSANGLSRQFSESAVDYRIASEAENKAENQTQ